MKDFIIAFLKKYASDRGLWVAVSAFLSHVICKKLGMETAQTTVADGLTSLAVWAVTHFLHVQVVENKLEKAVDLKPAPETKTDTEKSFDKDLNIKG